MNLSASKSGVTLVLCLILAGFNAACAQVVYGAGNYTQYHVGNLPIVISVPHDGEVEPATIPDRTCNNPTTARDIQTRSLAMQFSDSFFDATGCRPHLIICNLKRTKLDCNRNLADGACGNPEAIQAWTDFHHFIDSAQHLAHTASGNSFYIDLHGHGHTIQQLELGYLLTSTQLRLPDSVLNTQQYINYSAIKDLVLTNVNGLTHAQLLRGENALGTLLVNAGYPSVPSQQKPFPEVGEPYFNGGYSTVAHTSATAGITANGVQIETNWTNVRNNAVNRKAFADSLTHALTGYMNSHHNIILGNCNTLNANEPLLAEIKLYPSILPQRGILYIKTSSGLNPYLIIHDLFGRKISEGFVMEGMFEIKETLPAGMYVVSIMDGLQKNAFRIFIRD